MPCKTSLCRSGRETSSTIGEHKTKYACIVEDDECMRIRMEGAPHRYHEDHIAGKGMNSISHHNLVHKSILMPQAMKIPAAKAAVEMGNFCVELIPAQVNSGCARDRHGQRAAWCLGRLVSALMFVDTQQVLESRQIKITVGYKCTYADDTRTNRDSFYTD